MPNKMGSFTREEVAELVELAGGDKGLAGALAIAEALHRVARNLDALGLNQESAVGAPGGAEGIAMEIRDGLRVVAEAVGRE